jgi:hypothetical protein
MIMVQMVHSFSTEHFVDVTVFARGMINSVFQACYIACDCSMDPLFKQEEWTESKVC